MGVGPMHGGEGRRGDKCGGRERKGRVSKTVMPPSIGRK